MTVRAFVPLKRLSIAKSRLTGVLSADERRALVLSMAAHVIAVARAAVDDVVLLTAEPVAELGELRTVIDNSIDLNGNLQQGLAMVAAAPGDTALVIFADLPLIQVADIGALAAASARGVAIAPDRLGEGVNAVGFRQPLGIGFCFGAGSRRRFEAEARRLGRRPVLVERPALGLDIDDAESLSLYARERSCLGLTTP